MHILSSRQMREAEQALFSQGSITSLSLMDKAIERLARLCLQQPRTRYFSHCVVFAGHGNNAGDALGLALALDLPCTLRCGTHLSADAGVQLARLKASKLLRDTIPEGARLLIIDGLLGTGATGRLREPITSLIAELNELRLKHPQSCCLAIDIPSGLESEGDCVRADITATIGCAKSALFDDKATAMVGEILPIPLPEVPLQAASQPSLHLTTWDMVQAALPRRGYECYKNKTGHVHIIAGSKGYIGAAQLAAEAALRSGAGLVTLYALADVYDILAARLAPEIILRPISDYSQIDCSQAQALLIGPGLGSCSPQEEAELKPLIQSAPCPLILDADGLKLLSKLQLSPPASSILTPHEGEMRHLAGPKTSTRLDWAKQYIDAHPCTLLLKGARSIIASPQAIHFNSTGGPHMANAGQGDSLAGCIAALRAQGIPAHDAACAGAWICGQAAQYAQAAQGMSPHISASQVISMIPQVMAGPHPNNAKQSHGAMQS